METPDERRFRIFGTHEFIGSEPCGKDGLWIQWGKPFKAPTHAEVQDGIHFCPFLEGTGSVDRCIKKLLQKVKMISSCKTPAGPMKMHR